jgi:hypothetical protein
MKTRNLLCVSSLRAALRNNRDTQQRRTLECGGKRSATPLFANPSIPAGQQMSPIRIASVTPLRNRPYARSFPHPPQTLNPGASLLLEDLGLNWSLELGHWSFSNSLHLSEPSNFQTLNVRTSISFTTETPLRKTETSHPKLRQFGPLPTSYANFLLRQTQ